MLLFKECGFQYYWDFLTGARISWTRCLAKVWGVSHRNSWCCRHSNAYVILGHQEIHYKYNSNTIETKIEAEPRIWKVGKQVLCAERMLLTGATSTNLLIKINQSVP